MGDANFNIQIHERVNQYLNNNPKMPSTIFSETNSARRNCNNDQDGVFTTLSQITTILQRLNTKRSTGLDGIPNIVLKNCPLGIVIELSALFNQCTNEGYIQNQWRRVTVPQFNIALKDFGLQINTKVFLKYKVSRT